MMEGGGWEEDEGMEKGKEEDGSKTGKERGELITVGPKHL